MDNFKSKVVTIIKEELDKVLSGGREFDKHEKLRMIMKEFENSFPSDVNYDGRLSNEDVHILETNKTDWFIQTILNLN